MFFALLQNFVYIREIDEILAELHFENQARKCEVPAMFNYLFGAATFE